MDTQHFKELLEKESKTLESELSGIGKRNPANPNDWELKGTDGERDRADETEVADDIETLESNNAIIKQLEIRLAEVSSALEKIEKGNYGVCEVGGEQIEEDRLEANPAAKTCKVHMG